MLRLLPLLAWLAVAFAASASPLASSTYRVLNVFSEVPSPAADASGISKLDKPSKAVVTVKRIDPVDQDGLTAFVQLRVNSHAASLMKVRQNFVICGGALILIIVAAVVPAGAMLGWALTGALWKSHEMILNEMQRRLAMLCGTLEVTRNRERLTLNLAELNMDKYLTYYAPYEGPPAQVKTQDAFDIVRLTARSNINQISHSLQTMCTSDLPSMTELEASASASKDAMQKGKANLASELAGHALNLAGPFGTWFAFGKIGLVLANLIKEGGLKAVVTEVTGGVAGQVADNANTLKDMLLKKLETADKLAGEIQEAASAEVAVLAAEVGLSVVVGEAGDGPGESSSPDSAGSATAAATSSFVETSSAARLGGIEAWRSALLSDPLGLAKKAGAEVATKSIKEGITKLKDMITKAGGPVVELIVKVLGWANEVYQKCSKVKVWLQNNVVRPVKELIIKLLHSVFDSNGLASSSALILAVGKKVTTAFDGLVVSMFKKMVSGKLFEGTRGIFSALVKAVKTQMGTMIGALSMDTTVTAVLDKEGETMKVSFKAACATLQSFFAASPPGSSFMEVTRDGKGGYSEDDASGALNEALGSIKAGGAKVTALAAGKFQSVLTSIAMNAVSEKGQVGALLKTLMASWHKSDKQFNGGMMKMAADKAMDMLTSKEFLVPVGLGVAKYAVAALVGGPVGLVIRKAGEIMYHQWVENSKRTAKLAGLRRMMGPNSEPATAKLDMSYLSCFAFEDTLASSGGQAHSASVEFFNSVREAERTWYTKSNQIKSKETALQTGKRLWTKVRDFTTRSSKDDLDTFCSKPATERICASVVTQPSIEDFVSQYISVGSRFRLAKYEGQIMDVKMTVIGIGAADLLGMGYSRLPGDINPSSVTGETWPISLWVKRSLPEGLKHDANGKLLEDQHCDANGKLKEPKDAVTKDELYARGPITDLGLMSSGTGNICGRFTIPTVPAFKGLQASGLGNKEAVMSLLPPRPKQFYGVRQWKQDGGRLCVTFHPGCAQADAMQIILHLAPEGKEAEAGACDFKDIGGETETIERVVSYQTSSLHIPWLPGYWNYFRDLDWSSTVPTISIKHSSNAWPTCTTKAEGRWLDAKDVKAVPLKCSTSQMPTWCHNSNCGKEPASKSSVDERNEETVKHDNADCACSSKGQESYGLPFQVNFGDSDKVDAHKLHDDTKLWVSHARCKDNKKPICDIRITEVRATKKDAKPPPPPLPGYERVADLNPQKSWVSTNGDDGGNYLSGWKPLLAVNKAVYLDVCRCDNPVCGMPSGLTLSQIDERLYKYQGPLSSVNFYDELFHKKPSLKQESFLNDSAFILWDSLVDPAKVAARKKGSSASRLERLSSQLNVYRVGLSRLNYKQWAKAGADVQVVVGLSWSQADTGSAPLLQSELKTRAQIHNKDLVKAGKKIQMPISQLIAVPSHTMPSEVSNKLMTTKKGKEEKAFHDSLALIHTDTISWYTSHGWERVVPPKREGEPQTAAFTHELLFKRMPYSAPTPQEQEHASAEAKVAELKAAQVAALKKAVCDPAGMCTLADDKGPVMGIGYGYETKLDPQDKSSPSVEKILAETELAKKWLQFTNVYGSVGHTVVSRLCDDKLAENDCSGAVCAVEFVNAKDTVTMASSCEAKRASVLVVHVKDDTKALAAADLIRSTIDGQKDYTGVMPVVMVKGDLNGLSSIDMLRRHGKHPGVIKVVDRRPYSAKDTDDSQCGDSKDPNTCWTDRFLSVSRVDKDIASMSMAHIDISKSDSPPYPSMAARWHVVDPTYSEEGKTKGKAIKVTLLEKKLLKAGFHYVGVVLKKDLWARRGDLISKAGEGISISSSGSGKSEPSHTKGEFLVDILEADSEPADEPKKLQLKFGDGAPISTLYMDYDASKSTLTTTTNRAWSRAACDTELPSLTDFPNAHKSVYYSLAPGRRLINLKIAPGKWIPADGDVFNDASGQLPGKTGLRKSKVTNPEGDCFKGTLYIEKTCATRRRLDMGDLCDVPASVDDDSGAPVPTGGAVHSGKSQ